MLNRLALSEGIFRGSAAVITALSTINRHNFNAVQSVEFLVGSFIGSPEDDIQDMAFCKGLAFTTTGRHSVGAILAKIIIHISGHS